MAKERRIIMSAPMVRALLDGRKTQTRRVVKKPFLNEKGELRLHFKFTEPKEYREEHVKFAEICPYGVVGDRLWVRETFAETKSDGGPVITYKAGGHMVHGATGDKRAGTWKDEIFPGEVGTIYPPDKWKPSIFMPRWGSRITLELTGVRVERLQDIGWQDAIAEGISDPRRARRRISEIDGCVARYHQLWDSLHGKGAWDLNPWVWVLEFKKI